MEWEKIFANEMNDKWLISLRKDKMLHQKKKKKNKTVGLNRQVLKLSLVNKYENTQPV